jgi:hypothetical protein
VRPNFTVGPVIFGFAARRTVRFLATLLRGAARLVDAFFVAAFFLTARLGAVFLVAARLGAARFVAAFFGVAFLVAARFGVAFFVAFFLALVFLTAIRTTLFRWVERTSPNQNYLMPCWDVSAINSHFYKRLQAFLYLFLSFPDVGQR